MQLKFKCDIGTYLFFHRKRKFFDMHAAHCVTCQNQIPCEEDENPFEK